MARLINLSTPECGVTNGMELSFKAPCGCEDATGISLDGVTYDLIDASGNTLTSCSNYFVKDAILTVIIDTEKSKATLLNPNVNNYTKSLGTSSDTASATGTTVWARVKQLETDINAKADTIHNHTKSEITDFAHNHDDMYYTESEIDTKLSKKTDKGHTHTKSDITDFAHNHDDRYYTNTDINSKLSAKSDIGHTHTKADITNFPTSMPASDVSAWAKAANKPSYSYTEVGAAAASHKHVKSEITDFPTSMPASDVYPWAKASSKPSYTASEVGAASASHTHTKLQISDFAHNHDDRYYTETEIDSKIKTLNDTISGKSANGHSHNDLYYTETEVNNLLAGKSGTDHNHDSRYYTKGDIDSKFVSAYAEIDKKSDSGHAHDGRYYQKSETYAKSETYNKTEIDTKVSTLNTAISAKASSATVNNLNASVNGIISGSTTVGKATIANTATTATKLAPSTWSASKDSGGKIYISSLTLGKTYLISVNTAESYYMFRTFIIHLPENAAASTYEVISSSDAYGFFLQYVRASSGTPYLTLMQKPASGSATSKPIYNVVIQEI